jgi:hypothetical protein
MTFCFVEEWIIFACVCREAAVTSDASASVVQSSMPEIVQENVAPPPVEQQESAPVQIWTDAAAHVSVLLPT